MMETVNIVIEFLKKGVYIYTQYVGYAKLHSVRFVYLKGEITMKSKVP